MTSESSILPPNIQPTGLTVSVSAPGKVILHGEHSVVYGKLALSASLGLRTRTRLTEITAPNLAVFQFTSVDYVSTYDLQKLKEHLLLPALPLTHNPSDFNWEYPDMLHHGSVVDLVENFISQTTGTGSLTSHQVMTLSSVFFLITGILGSVNVEINPFLLVSETQLSVGAGTGSSASYLVGVTAALIRYVKLRSGGQGNVSKEGYKPYIWDLGGGEGFTKRELDMICNWAFCAEKIIHGTPSGVDNTICTYGGIVEFRKGLPPKLLETSRPIQIILINSNVQRETKKMVGKVTALHRQYPDLTNNILNAMEDVAFIALHHLTELCSSTGGKVIENCYKELGRLAKINQELLSALGVSHLRLDEAILILEQNGLYGKLTGAGGGGYAICLVPPYVNQDVVAGVLTTLNSRGFQAALTELGGIGVTVE